MAESVPMHGFNPFAHVNGRYGAPMGRHGWGSYDPAMTERHGRYMRGEEGYDEGGAYWGQDRVWAIWAGEPGGEVEFLAYVEADSVEEAFRVATESAHA